ncbi:hypothetical protein J6590_105838, partial [Homalodisca vitripennis]
SGTREAQSGALRLRIPIHRTKTYNGSFTVTACRLWNSLPDPVKQIESRKRFVVELRRRYLDRHLPAVLAIPRGLKPLLALGESRERLPVRRVTRLSFCGRVPLCWLRVADSQKSDQTVFLWPCATLLAQVVAAFRHLKKHPVTQNKHCIREWLTVRRVTNCLSVARATLLAQVVAAFSPKKHPVTQNKHCITEWLTVRRVTRLSFCGRVPLCWLR